jgi:hypothetical protein
LKNINIKNNDFFLYKTWWETHDIMKFEFLTKEKMIIIFVIINLWSLICFVTFYFEEIIHENRKNDDFCILCEVQQKNNNKKIDENNWYLLQESYFFTEFRAE